MQAAGTGGMGSWAQSVPEAELHKETADGEVLCLREMMIDVFADRMRRCRFKQRTLRVRTTAVLQEVSSYGTQSPSPQSVDSSSTCRPNVRSRSHGSL